MPLLASDRLVNQLQRSIGDLVEPVSITVYNKYTSSSAEAYTRRVLVADMWSNRKAQNVIRSGGFLDADSATIIISSVRDGNESYYEALAWNALATKIGWTLQRGDVIVKGSVSKVISSSYHLSNLMNDYEEVVRISSIDIRNLGNVKHWVIGVK